MVAGGEHAVGGHQVVGRGSALGTDPASELVGVVHPMGGALFGDSFSRKGSRMELFVGLECLLPLGSWKLSAPITSGRLSSHTID